MSAVVDLKKVANHCVPFQCIPSKYFHNLSVDTSLDYKLDLTKFTAGVPANTSETALMVMPGYGSYKPTTSITSQSDVMKPCTKPCCLPYSNTPLISQCFNVTASRANPGYYSQLPLRHTNLCSKNCPKQMDRPTDMSRNNGYYTRRSAAAFNGVNHSQFDNYSNDVSKVCTIPSRQNHLSINSQVLPSVPPVQQTNLYNRNAIPVSLPHTISRNPHQTVCQDLVTLNQLVNPCVNDISNSVSQPTRIIRRAPRRSRRLNPQVPPQNVIDLTCDSPTLPAVLPLQTSLDALIDSCDNPVIVANAKTARRQPFTSVSEMYHAQQAPATFLYPLTPVSGHTLNAKVLHNNSSQIRNHLITSSPSVVPSAVPCGSSGVPYSQVVNSFAERAHKATLAKTSNNNMPVFTDAHLSTVSGWVTDDVRQMPILQSRRQQMNIYSRNTPATQQTLEQTTQGLPYNTRKRSRETASNYTIPLPPKKQCITQETVQTTNKDTNEIDHTNRLASSFNEQSIFTTPENFDSFVNLYLFSTDKNTASSIFGEDTLAISNNSNSKRLIDGNASLASLPRTIHARGS